MEAGGTTQGFPVRAFTVLPVVGLAAWVAATIVAAIVLATPTDPTPMLNTFVAGGAIYFSLLFGAQAVMLRRTQRRTHGALFHRLALVPVDRADIARATGPMFTIGYVYIGFGAVVTALGLIGIGIGADAGRPFLIAMVVVLVLWLAFMLYALWRARATTAVVVHPLGLTVTDFVAPAVTLDHRVETVGAMGYAGVRHGRRVVITQTSDRAVTIVGDVTGTVDVPTTAVDMAKRTGEPVRSFRNVHVVHDGDSIVVTRRGNGAGAWFLHDLLLAEAVAGART